MLLGLGEVRRLLLLAGFKLHNLGREHIVSVVNFVCVLFHLFELLLQSAELVLVICLLLLSLFEAERLIR